MIPAPVIDGAPDDTRASLPTPFKAAVAANWSLKSSSVAEVDAQVSDRRRADLAAAEQALVTGKKLTLR